MARVAPEEADHPPALPPVLNGISGGTHLVEKRKRPTKSTLADDAGTTSDDGKVLAEQRTGHVGAVPTPNRRTELPTLRNLLTKLETPPFDISAQRLRERLGVNASCSIIERWLMIGAALALEQPEYRGEPKRRRGRPKGAKKPLKDRADKGIQGALDAYELQAEASVSSDEMFERSDTVMALMKRLPATFDPRVNGVGLPALIEAVGGVEAVCNALNTTNEKLQQLVDVERRINADHERNRQAWREARASVKKSAAASSKGNAAAAAIKALKRLHRSRFRARIAELLGNYRTK